MWQRLLNLVVGVTACLAAAAPPLAAQSIAPVPEPGPTTIALHIGAGFPFSGAIAKNSGLFGLAASRRLSGPLEVAVDVVSLYDGRSRSGNKGEGSFVSSGLLVHGGIRRWHSTGSLSGHYGGGVSYAHYSSQVGVYRAICVLCGSRNGWGVYGAVGAGLHLNARRGGVQPWIGVDLTVDTVTTSGAFGITNPSTLKTRDGWVSIRGVLGFRF